MSIHESRTTTESTDTEPRGPRNGLAQALLEADPETPVEELPKLLDDVERWVCTRCGKKNFVKPKNDHCGQCGRTSSFDRVIPNGGGDDDAR